MKYYEVFLFFCCCCCSCCCYKYMLFTHWVSQLVFLGTRDTHTQGMHPYSTFHNSIFVQYIACLLARCGNNRRYVFRCLGLWTNFCLQSRDIRSIFTCLAGIGQLEIIYSHISWYSKCMWIPRTAIYLKQTRCMATTWYTSQCVTGYLVRCGTELIANIQSSMNVRFLRDAKLICRILCWPNIIRPSLWLYISVSCCLKLCYTQHSQGQPPIHRFSEENKNTYFQMNVPLFRKQNKAVDERSQTHKSSN